MIRTDYFVITMPRNASADAQFPSLVGQYVFRPQEQRIMQYYGYKGSNNTFVGQSADRIMIWALDKMRIMLQERLKQIYLTVILFRE